MKIAICRPWAWLRNQATDIYNDLGRTLTVASSIREGLVPWAGCTATRAAENVLMNCFFWERFCRGPRSAAPKSSTTRNHGAHRLHFECTAANQVAPIIGVLSYSLRKVPDTYGCYRLRWGRASTVSEAAKGEGAGTACACRRGFGFRRRLAAVPGRLKCLSARLDAEQLATPHPEVDRGARQARASFERVREVAVVRCGECPLFLNIV